MSKLKQFLRLGYTADYLNNRTRAHYYKKLGAIHGYGIGCIRPFEHFKI